MTKEKKKLLGLQIRSDRNQYKQYERFKSQKPQIKNVETSTKTRVMIQDRLTEQQLRAFDEWLDNSPYHYYDGMERLIHFPTKQLFSFDEVYRKFMADTITDYETKMFTELSKAIAS